MTTETAQPGRRKGGPKDIPANVGVKGRKVKGEVEVEVENLPALADADTAKLPETYERACKALAECDSIDECKDWADKAAAMASYARQAKDKTFFDYATRIRARAVRQAGELLQAIPAQPGKGSGGRPAEKRGSLASGERFPKASSTTQRSKSARAQAAASSGLSPDQAKTAMQVANVPQADFEEQVESEKPPSVSQLAEQGKKQIRAQRKAEVASTGENVRAITVFAHEQFAEHVEALVHICRRVGDLGKVPPDLPRKLARELLDRIEEARSVLNALRRGLRAIVDSDEPEEEQPEVHPRSANGEDDSATAAPAARAAE
jgi:hypothetical protein